MSKPCSARSWSRVRWLELQCRSQLVRISNLIHCECLKQSWRPKQSSSAQQSTMPHKRSRLLMSAHMVGLPERQDPLPGTQDRLQSSNTAQTQDNESNFGKVRVSFKQDPAREPLQKALLSALHWVRTFVRECRRLGLPRHDISEKFRFYRQAFKDPRDAVMLDGSTERMLRAKAAGTSDSQNLAYRPKPRFRTREPGVKTIIAFNLAFVLWLMYGSW